MLYIQCLLVAFLPGLPLIAAGPVHIPAPSPDPAAYSRPDGWFPDAFHAPYQETNIHNLPDEVSQYLTVPARPSARHSSQRFNTYDLERGESVFDPEGAFDATVQSSLRVGDLIELSTRSGLEYDRTFLSLQLRTEYRPEISGKISYRVRIRAADTIGRSGDWGIFLYAQRLDRTFGSNHLRTRWDTAPYLGSPVTFLENFQVRTTEVRRDRRTVGLNLDWEPGHGKSSFFIRTVFMDSTDHEIRNSLQYEVDFETGDPFPYRDVTVNENGIATSGSLLPRTGRLDRKLKDENERENRYGIFSGFRHRMDSGWELNTGAEWAYRDKREPFRLDSEYRYRRLGDFAGVSPWTYRIENPERPILVLNPFNDPRVDAFSPANFPLQKWETENNNRQWEFLHLHGSLANEWQLHNISAKFTTGAGYVKRREKRDNTYERYEQTNLTGLSRVSDALSPRQEAVLGYPATPYIDPALARDEFLLKHHQVPFLQRESAFFSDIEDYLAHEDIFAAFMELFLESGPWFGTIGLRGEETRGTYAAFDARWDGQEPSGNPLFPGGGTMSSGQIQVRRSYFDWLPVLRAGLQLRPDFRTEIALSGAVVRPNMRDVAPYYAFNADNGNNPELFAGNPDLGRTRMHQIEWMAEWSPKAAGLYQIAAFYREFDNPFFRTGAWQDLTGIDGHIRRYNVTTFDNTESGRMHGIRLHLTQYLHILPSPLDTAGFYFNYHWKDSRQTVNTGPFPRRTLIAENPEHTVSSGIFFRRNGWLLRVGALWQGKALYSIGQHPDGSRGTGDIWVDDYIDLNCRLEWEFSQHLEFFFDAFNLLHEKRRIYEGTPLRTIEYQDYGQTFRLGVQWRL